MISQQAAPDFPSYKPSAFYFRDALRNARSKAEAVEIGLHAVLEIENLKKQMRDAGLVPTPRFVLTSELDAKNLSLLRQMSLRVVGQPAILGDVDQSV